MISKAIELLPFRTPNYVVQKTEPRPRQEGMVEAPKYALSELKAEELAALCDQFRAEIFQKAGKVDPIANDSERSSSIS